MQPYEGKKLKRISVDSALFMHQLPKSADQEKRNWVMKVQKFQSPSLSVFYCFLNEHKVAVAAPVLCAGCKILFIFFSGIKHMLYRSILQIIAEPI